MNKDTPEYFDKLLGELENRQSALIEEAEDVCNKIDEELAMIKEVMAKHHLSYKNEAVKAESKRGIVIGKHGNSPLILEHGYVFEVDESDEIDIESKQSLRQFLVTADLEAVKSGINYVKKMRGAEDNSISERNKELRKFMSDVIGFKIENLL